MSFTTIFILRVHGFWSTNNKTRLYCRPLTWIHLSTPWVSCLSPSWTAVCWTSDLCPPVPPSASWTAVCWTSFVVPNPMRLACGPWTVLDWWVDWAVCGSAQSGPPSWNLKARYRRNSCLGFDGGEECLCLKKLDSDGTMRRRKVKALTERRMGSTLSAEKEKQKIPVRLSRSI